MNEHINRFLNANAANHATRKGFSQAVPKRTFRFTSAIRWNYLKARREFNRAHPLW